MSDSTPSKEVEKKKISLPLFDDFLLGHESLNTTTRYVNASDRFAQETHRKFHPLSEQPS